MKYINNVKLGLFVLISVTGLVILFYLVSKKNTFWSSDIELRAQFSNVQGLQKGNNVRYGGMHIGTVKDIYLVNDSTIEVLMDINGATKNYIHLNSVASIVSDGFVGDKLVNISGGQGLERLVNSGDLIHSKSSMGIDQLMDLVDAPENGIKSLLASLNLILKKIENSNALWEITSDKNFYTSIRTISANLENSSASADVLLKDLNATVKEIKGGRGIVGSLLNDTSYVARFDTLILKTNDITVQANELLEVVNNTVGSINNDINNGKGIAHAVLKDSLMIKKMERSIETIEGTASSFNEVMDALKTSFLLRKSIRRNQKNKKH